MYDFANSAFATTMMAAVMPIYYKTVAGSGLAGNTAENYWGFTQSIAMLLVAVMSPLAGAIADASGSKLKFLGFFTVLGAAASALMALVGNGDWLLASVLVVLGTIGFTTGGTFYDALLADGVPEERRHLVSAQGYAMGYIGGGLLLAINIAMIEGWSFLGFQDKTSATQAAFVTVGVWWLLFSLPILRWVKEQPVPHVSRTRTVAVREGLARLVRTVRSLKAYPELLKYMAAFWFFNDGISTVIVMATIYGSGIGIGQTDLILALLITQFIGFPSTLLFGRLAVRFGARRMLQFSLTLYVIIVILGFLMTTALHFYALAFLVGLVQGGSQAVARSLYAGLLPPARTAEFFGFLALSSKFSSILGPLVFSVVGTITGSSRWSILSLIAFFVIGIIILATVDFAKGSREAAGTTS
ncbi:MFS transporter [Paenibacillus beijingensis]|nr:MFS transporter [Paenibacillus beijingensis]